MIPSRGEQYVFACHRWLATDEDDHQLEVELDPSYKEDMEKSKSGIPFNECKLCTLWIIYTTVKPV